MMSRRVVRLSCAAALVGLAASCIPPTPRHDVAELRRGYTQAFFDRHETTYRRGAAIHVAHGKAHDVLQLTPLAEAARFDAAFDAEMVATLERPPRVGPSMMSFAPHTGQAAWPIYNAIDWTHGHHDATYDILADADVAWADKERRTREAVDYYLRRNPGAARSPAPLEITMARAAVMMKPYFGAFRTHYPRAATYFFVAHWWHPAAYEAMMVAGNDAEQERALDAVDAHIVALMNDVDARPQRMLLSREIMPRYSRMSPESANIFDNLHMLHGIIYDILAYEGWTVAEKSAELERVVAAMSEHPGDRELARAFALTKPDLDPRRYEPWMRGVPGAMTTIMRDMLVSMWPMMSPDGSKDVPPAVLEALRTKARPGLQPGEHPGSLHDAVMALVPDMKMNPADMAPGVTPAMAQMMTAHATQMLRARAPAAPLPMDAEPRLDVAVASHHLEGAIR